MSEAVQSARDEVTEDAFLGGRLICRQFKRGHRAGHDAVLLAAATPAKAGERVVEFGAGVGVAALAVATRVNGVDLALVEIDAGLVELARANAASNHVKAHVAQLDVGGTAADFEAAGLPPDSADVVLMNPPFHGADRHRASPDEARERAHFDRGATLDVWIHAARRLLKSGGSLVLIWRADDLGGVLAALSRGFGGVEVFPVFPKPGSVAVRVVVRAVKASRAPVRLFEGLVLNDEAGQPTPEAKSCLEGAAIFPSA